MNSVNFTNPYLLFIAIPLVILVSIPFFVAIRRKKFNLHNLTSLGLHLGIVALLTLALAGLSVIGPNAVSEVIVLCDVSASDEHSLEKIQQYVDDISENLGNDEFLAIVAFGKDQQTVKDFSSARKDIQENSVDRSATNIEQALYFAQEMFEEGANKRIILISDGKETDGSALAAVKKLENEDIRIDTVFINEEKNFQEVLIDQVSFNESSYLNAEEKVKVYLRANCETSVKVSLYQNKSVIDEKDINTVNGVTSVDFLLDTYSYGVKNYRVEVETLFDTQKENNVGYFTQYVAKEPRVLIVGGTAQDIAATRPLYDYDSVDTILARECPNTIEYLGGYDIIVLSEVDLRTIPSAQVFADNLQTVVADYGKSLMVYGGTNTYGEGTFLGNYTRMLPVNYDISKSSTAIILVIDSSLSMRTDNRIDMAKKGAINCLDLLGDDDFISVITFSGTVDIVVPLMRVIDREDVIKKINSIEMERNTMMTAGLKAAYEQIKGLNFDSKQVLLISDGMPGDRGQEEVVQDLLAENVTTSVINIASAQGENFLKNLSTIGNGNYYYISSVTNLPDIMLNEVNNDIGITKVEQNCTPIFRKENDAALVGIESLPDVGGLNYSIAKYAATTVLTCKFLDDNLVTKEAPLYLYWAYGLGKVSLLNTGLSEDWSSDWLKQSAVKQFMSNIIAAEMPATRQEEAYTVDLINMGICSRLEVVSENPARKDVMTATVTCPGGEKLGVNLTLTNGIYSAEFGGGEQGYYTIELSYQKGGRIYDNRYYKAYSYSPEYNTFDLGNEYLLYQCTLKDGKLTSDMSSIGLNWKETGMKEISLVLPFLAIAIVLFIIDIAIRKLKWADILYLVEGDPNDDDDDE